MPILIIEEKKNHKYSAKGVSVDGIKFPSKHEARHYQQLLYRLKAKEISNLRVQVAYRLEINGELIGHYYADFVFEEAGEEIVCDAKGFKTDVYRLKKKMMKALHNIEIREL